MLHRRALSLLYHVHFVIWLGLLLLISSYLIYVNTVISTNRISLLVQSMEHRESVYIHMQYGTMLKLLYVYVYICTLP